jgi:DNA-binding PadR family transcriptional regulator
MSMNTLSYGLLGLLARRESSGYDLMLRIQPFWQAKHSQIYPLLSSMEEKQLLSSHWVQQSDKPDKKIYAITEKGMQKLREWMYQPIAPAVTKDELSLRTFCLWLTEIGIAVDIFEDRRIGYLEKKRYYEQILAGIPEDTREIGSKVFSNYVLATKGLMMAETELKWCDWVLELLRQQQRATATNHGRTNFETLS